MKKTKLYKKIEYSVEKVTEADGHSAYLGYVLEPFKYITSMPTAKMTEDRCKKAIDYYLEDKK